LDCAGGCQRGSGLRYRGLRFGQDDQPVPQVWNRQRTDFDLADPANTSLGHRQVQRWNLPEGWVISRHPAHAALVSEADFIAAQQVEEPRGPAGPAVRRYLLAGLIACGRCGRRLESAWSNGKPAYRCRHG
jgi:site-specific DNA recombinase